MNTLHIDTKSRFNNLSDIDKENVLLFLEDKYTEEYVCIKQHEDGLITVQDYQESEFSELSDKRGYVKRDKLLKNIYMLDYKDFKYKVSRKQGVAHTITVCDGTVFTVRNDESDSKDILYFYYGHAFHRTGNTERCFAECVLDKFPNARITTTEQQIERRKFDKKDNFVTHSEFMTNEYPMTGVCTGVHGYTIDNGRSAAWYMGE
jgi:hypothetical protein